MAKNPNAKKASPRVEPILSGVLAANAVPMPTRNTNRGSKSLYPFSQLTAVGMSFAVFNKTPEQLASIISNQNRKPGPPKRDASGAIVYKTTDVLGADSKPTGQKIPTNEQEHDKGAQFFAVVPAPDDPARNDATGKPLPKDKQPLARVFRNE